MRTLSVVAGLAMILTSSAGLAADRCKSLTEADFQRYFSCFNARDMACVAAFYTPDVTLSKGPNWPEVRGPADIVAFYRDVADHGLREQFDRDKPQLRGDMELVRKVYLDLVQTPEYAQYITSPLREKQEERKILEFILNDLILANETVVAHIEENFSNWDDDGELVVQLLAGYLQKPGSYDFKNLLSADKAQFAKALLQTVIEKADHLEGVIVPKLKNWDPERIAHLDMVLMKMGVAEFLYFETIPPKVTINEYIDLAKEYSTPQSGQFVNGILDNIHKELVQQGKMHKVDYKKA